MTYTRHLFLSLSSSSSTSPSSSSSTVNIIINHHHCQHHRCHHCRPHQQRQSSFFRDGLSPDSLLTVAIVANRPKQLQFSTSSTLSTIAPLLATIVQKSQKNLSLHHKHIFPNRENHQRLNSTTKAQKQLLVKKLFQTENTNQKNPSASVYYSESSLPVFPPQRHRLIGILNNCPKVVPTV